MGQSRISSTVYVTPFVGVWIEICVLEKQIVNTDVTPFVGVWIEIQRIGRFLSLSLGHSLRGSVD